MQRPGEDGFTLLELLVVLLVIVLVTGVFTTTLGGGFGVHMRNAGRTLAAELEYVGQRAVTTGKPQRVVIDLDQQVYRVEELSLAPSPAELEPPEHAENLDLAPPLSQLAFEPVEGRIGEWRALDDADEVRMREVRLADEAKQDGMFAIGFAPDGACDPAEIWLRDDGGYDLRIRLVAFTGEIRIEEPEPETP
jgi:type II secretion system protein H